MLAYLFLQTFCDIRLNAERACENKKRHHSYTSLILYGGYWIILSRDAKCYQGGCGQLVSTSENISTTQCRDVFDIKSKLFFYSHSVDDVGLFICLKVKSQPHLANCTFKIVLTKQYLAFQTLQLSFTLNRFSKNFTCSVLMGDKLVLVTAILDKPALTLLLPPLLYREYRCVTLMLTKTFSTLTPKSKRRLRLDCNSNLTVLMGM